MSEARITATLDRRSAERLISEHFTVLKTAAAIAVECSDDKLTGTQRKYVGLGIASRIVAAQLAWPVSVEQLAEGLQRNGIARERAHELAELLAAENTIRPEREQLSDRTAAGEISALLNGGPYVRVNVEPTASPAPQPITPAVGPEPHENPVTEHDYPQLDAARAASTEEAS
jgi:hypothetical protein